MTSRIEVFAHCAEDKEVVIIETDNADPTVNKRTLLQNGDHYELVVYDDRVVTVQELLKV